MQQRQVASNGPLGGLSLHPRQQDFIDLECDEALFGGATGGGKTYCLLAWLGQGIQIPEYSALFLRRTFAQLEKSNDSAIMKSFEIYGPLGGVYNAGNKRWTFPSGARIEFGHMQHQQSMINYQGGGYHRVAYDEITQFTQLQYDWMYSRMRKKDDGFPISMGVRCAGNPGGEGHCVPYGDVMTPDGWRDIHGMQVGDAVYAVTRTGKLVESVVDQIHTQDFDGDLINIDTRNLRAVFTPSHRLVYRNESGRLERRAFDDLPGQARILRSSLEWKGRRVDRFDVPPCEVRRRSVNVQPESLLMRDYAAFMGWFLSEGSVVARDKAFVISQSKDTGRREIQSLLDRCGFHYLTGKHGYLVHSRRWYEYLKQFGKCRDKFVPRDLMDADTEILVAFLAALMAGDGCSRSDGPPLHGTYYTTSRQLADDVCEIAVKLGLIASLYWRHRKNRRGLHYSVNLTSTKTSCTELLTGNHLYDVGTRTRRRSNVTRPAFHGQVCCIGVRDHHTFVIRQRGSVWVSGNSWVKAHFITPAAEKAVKSLSPYEPSPRDIFWADEGRCMRAFVPSRCADNPTLDVEDYIERMLLHLPPILRMQLVNGDWSAVEGAQIRQDQLRYFRMRGDNILALDAKGNPLGTVVNQHSCQRFATIDTAGTSKQKAAEDKGRPPSWSVCGIFDYYPGPKHLYLRHVWRRQVAWEELVGGIEDTLRQWKPTTVVIEHAHFGEPLAKELNRRGIGSTQLVNPVVPGMKSARAGEVTSAKLERAVAAGLFLKLQAAELYIPDVGTVVGAGAWLPDFESEILGWTGLPDETADQIDMWSYGCHHVQAGAVAWGGTFTV